MSEHADTICAAMDRQVPANMQSFILTVLPVLLLGLPVVHPCQLLGELCCMEAATSWPTAAEIGRRCLPAQHKAVRCAVSSVQLLEAQWICG